MDKLYCLGLWLFLFGFVTEAFAQNNVPSISNSTLEVVGSCKGDWDDGCLTGYSAYKSDRSTAFVGSTVNETGNRRLTFRFTSSDSTDDAVYAHVSGLVKGVVEGNLYRLSAWVKANELSGESVLFVKSGGDENPSNIHEIAEISHVIGPSSSSTWIKVNLAFRAPSSQGPLIFGMAASVTKQSCSTTDCGSVHFDNISIETLSQLPLNAPFPSHTNVCDEGEFLSTREELCRELVRQYGYTHTSGHESTTYMPCDAISSSSINNLIDSFAGKGGSILLAPCKAALDDDIELASNITLRGAGVGRTVLYRDANWDDDSSTLIRAKGEITDRIENIVLTDLSIQGSGPVETPMNNIQIRYAKNVLVERIETRDAGKSGISTRSSQGVTIRYIVGQGSVRWHGIESKDCYIHESMDGADKDLLISRHECAYGVSDYYTENIAIHSNTVFNNRGLGIDSHASHSEVAGNSSFSNGSASKFPEPANNVWIHHNEFTDGSREGMKIALQKRIGDETLVPYNHVIFNNVFRRNRGYGIRIHDRAHNIFLIANEYTDNDYRNRLRIVRGRAKGARVFICASDGSLNYGVDGHTRDFIELESSHAKCDIGSVANIFATEKQ